MLLGDVPIVFSIVSLCLVSWTYLKKPDSIPMPKGAAESIYLPFAALILYSVLLISTGFLTGSCFLILI